MTFNKLAKIFGTNVEGIAKMIGKSRQGMYMLDHTSSSNRARVLNNLADTLELYAMKMRADEADAVANRFKLRLAAIDELREEARAEVTR